MRICRVHTTYGREARDRRSETAHLGVEGARAALETFYCAFNTSSLEIFDSVWAEHELIALNNPLGNIQHGIGPIRELYRGIFEGPADVWVEFHDIVEYTSPQMVVFAGRERGEFTRDGVSVELSIRTSRVFAWSGSRWQQVHHHGSIDDAGALLRYQDAVRGL